MPASGEGRQPGLEPGLPNTLPPVLLADRLLAAIEGAILPLTRAGVARGDKVFGAALLLKSDGAVVLAETNGETENPLWHGEVHLIKRFHERLGGRPAPGSLIFLSTHEPCSMCLSAIAWAGFDNFHYLFSHEDSRDAFAIPHDLRILKEVFGLDPGGYRRENVYWTGRSIRALAAELPEPDRARTQARIAAVTAEYAELSQRYQAGKADNAIPLA